MQWTWEAIVTAVAVVSTFIMGVFYKLWKVASWQVQTDMRLEILEKQENASVPMLKEVLQKVKELKADQTKHGDKEDANYKELRDHMDKQLHELDDKLSRRISDSVGKVHDKVDRFILDTHEH